MFAMDFLKKELERKRKQVQTNFGGCKFMKRSEIEQKEIERIREEEQQELHLKTLRKNASENADKHNASAPLKSDKSKASAASGEEELRIDELVLPRAEVIRRLRILKQPITLFGEDDEARLDRLKILLKSGIVDVDSDMTEGQRNDFLCDLAELKRKEKSGMVMKRKKAEKEKEGEDVKDKEGLDDPDNGGSSVVDCDKDFKKMKANFDELCDEDKILVFFKRLLDEWEQELEDRPEAEKRTGKGKSMYATFKQCARYLTPLFNFCRKKALPDDIKQALLIIVECCIKRDYLAAMDQYIKLAIGNAPWPIGVTMVGIHERSAREKIYTNSVAHIMNDETTRKYLQSVKRLMTLCQRRYPSLPSKSVEFNSLANGSDLQSLLAEEKQKGAGQNIEEELRLTAA